MIQNKTARELLYAWHGGQSSPFYAAASSGLVASFVALADECMRIDEPDRGRLMSWLQHTQTKAPRVTVGGREYQCLPWAKEYGHGNQG